MKSLLLVTLVGAFLAGLGCGGGSGKRVDSSVGGAGGSGGSLATGSGGSLANGSGGSSASGSGGSLTKGSGGSTSSGSGGALAGSGGSGGAGSDASASGGSDGSVAGGTCPPSTFTPCGGNVVGTWHLKFDECVFSSASSFCAGMTYVIAPTSTYGVEYTFNANGTLSASISGNFIATIHYPPECLGSDAGAVQACADFSNSVQNIAQQVADAGTDNIMSASYICSPDSSGMCVCNENVAYTPRTMTGTYTTSGTQITITSLSGPGIADGGPADGGTGSPSGYCVSGNTFILGPSSGSSGAPVVLTK